MMITRRRNTARKDNHKKDRRPSVQNASAISIASQPNQLSQTQFHLSQQLPAESIYLAVVHFVIMIIIHLSFVLAATRNAWLSSSSFLIVIRNRFVASRL